MWPADAMDWDSRWQWGFRLFSTIPECLFLIRDFSLRENIGHRRFWYPSGRQGVSTRPRGERSSVKRYTTSCLRSISSGKMSNLALSIAASNVFGH